MNLVVELTTEVEAEASDLETAGAAGSFVEEQAAAVAASALEKTAL